MAERSMFINFDEILRIMHTGVIRAGTFMGYGINAAEDPNFKNYQLTKFTNIAVVLPDLSDERIADDKKNFRRWIECNGLRELTEAFSLFIDAIHQACMFIAVENPIPADFDSASRQTRFSKKGLEERLDILERKFGVEPKHRDQVVSINRARNCLSHRWGTVGDDDVDDQSVLKISWLGLDMVLREPNGNEIVFRHDSEPIFLAKGAKAVARVTMREHAFKVGEQFSLSTHDIAEICWFYQNESIHVHKSALAFAESKGHVIQAIPKA
jgi:hypothetical protein